MCEPLAFSFEPFLPWIDKNMVCLRSKQRSRLRDIMVDNIITRKHLIGWVGLYGIQNNYLNYSIVVLYTSTKAKCHWGGKTKLAGTARKLQLGFSTAWREPKIRS